VNLEFWETYDAPQVAPYLSQLNAALRNGGAAAKADTLKADTTAAAEPAAEAAGDGKFNPACAAIIRSLPTKRAQFPYLQEMAQKK
jgi:SecD/SecF fusion protein